MAEVLKVLAQSLPSAGVLTDGYVVPAGNSSVISSLVVANLSSSPTSFRLAIAVAGAADQSKQYVYYDTPISGNDSMIAVVGITLGPADVVRTYSASGQVSFNFFGVERT